MYNLVKLNKEGIEKYPHFFDEVKIIAEDENRYRIQAIDNRQKWIEKKFLDEDKPKKIKPKKEDANKE